MKKIIVVSVMSCAILCGFACRTTELITDIKDSDKYKSENYILRKRIQLVERTNAVVESENDQFRKQVQQQKGKIEELTGSYASLEKETSQKIDQLGQAMKKMEKEYQGRINTLSDQSDAMEKDLRNQIKNITSKLDDAQNVIVANIQALEALKKERIQCAAGLDTALKDLKAKTETIGELSQSLAKVQSAVMERDEAIGKKDASISELNDRIGKLNTKVDELDQSAKECRDRLDTLQK